MWHDVLDCSLQFLTAFFKTLYAVGEEEPKEELKKRLSAFDTYFKQNDKYLGGEPILLLRQRKEKARMSFFPGWALKSLVLYTNQIIASQPQVCSKGKDDSGQKYHMAPRLSPIISSLSPNFSLPFFPLFWMRICCPASIKFTQIKRMAGLPMKIFIFPLPPQLWNLWKLHKFIGVIVDRYNCLNTPSWGVIVL